MTKLYRCVCGETTDTQDLQGWAELGALTPSFDNDHYRNPYDILHLCPTCSLAVRQIAQDTQDDNQGEPA